MSLDEIAYLTEMNRTEMTVLERGGGDLQLGTLTRLSAVLKVPVGEFFEGIAWGSLVPEDTMPRRFVVVPARDDPTSAKRTVAQLDEWLDRR